MSDEELVKEGFCKCQQCKGRGFIGYRPSFDGPTLDVIKCPACDGGGLLPLGKKEVSE